MFIILIIYSIIFSQQYSYRPASKKIANTEIYLGKINTDSSIVFFIDEEKSYALEARLEDEKKIYNSPYFNLNDNPCISIKVKKDEEKYRIPSLDELFLFYEFIKVNGNIVLLNNQNFELVKIYISEKEDRANLKDYYDLTINNQYWLTTTTDNINPYPPYSLNLFIGDYDKISSVENDLLRIRCIRTISLK